MNTQKKLSLYQLTNEYESLLAKLYDYETGEINPEMEERLNALAPTSEKKFISVASWVKKMESEKLQLEHFEQEVIQRKAAYDKQIEWFNNYLKNNMERQRITEINCPYFKLRIKTNPYSTDVYDQSQLPPEFINIKVTEKIEYNSNKNAIKEQFIKTGIQVPGSYVSQKTKLEIIINKI